MRPHADGCSRSPARSGSAPDRVFAVPGNHDVDRSADADRDTRRLVQSLRSGADALDEVLDDPKDRAHLAARLRPFLEFAGGLAPACLGLQDGPNDALHWSHRFDARTGLRVRLLGLDTALLSANGDDRGKLQIGNKQISDGVIEPSIDAGEAVIALSHHPLHGGWLADEKQASAWLRSYAQVHLHSQMHEADAEALRLGGGSELVRVAATSRGFNVAAVVRTEGGVVLRIWPRAWSEKNKQFLVDVDNAERGQWFAEHALRLDLGAPDAPQVARAPLVNDALFEGPGAAPAVTVPHFLGREAEMDALRRALVQDVEAVCVVASGIGGIGKTTLVREFVATEARELFPEGVAWLDGPTLPSELGRVAQRFGWKRERLPTVEEANAWLANALHDRAVLLVVDNADAAQASEIPVPGENAGRW